MHTHFTLSKGRESATGRDLLYRQHRKMYPIFVPVHSFKLYTILYEQYLYKIHVLLVVRRVGLVVGS